MGLLSQSIKFTLPDDTVKWTVTCTEKIRTEAMHYKIKRDGNILVDETRKVGVESMHTTQMFTLEPGLEIEVGYVSLTKMACEIYRDGKSLHRTHTKPFRQAGKFDAALAKMDNLTEAEPAEMTDEKRAMLKRQKDLQPSIAIDIGFGILFFFVAREFGLVTAALTGAGATLVLFAIQPFVKWNLLGGFAVFGVVMSLISASIAWGFQDDLAIKLRGTFMAILGGSAALFDAFVLGGSYLGKRMAMYMEGLGKLNPKRASIALAIATFIIMGIDTPLAFILTTEQWIWYNSVFDMLISIPIVMGCMYWAREKPTDRKDIETS